MIAISRESAEEPPLQCYCGFLGIQANFFDGLYA